MSTFKIGDVFMINSKRPTLLKYNGVIVEATQVHAIFGISVTFYFPEVSYKNLSVKSRLFNIRISYIPPSDLIFIGNIDSTKIARSEINCTFFCDNI